MVKKSELKTYRFGKVSKRIANNISLHNDNKSSNLSILIEETTPVHQDDKENHKQIDSYTKELVGLKIGWKSATLF